MKLGTVDPIAYFCCRFFIFLHSSYLNSLGHPSLKFLAPPSVSLPVFLRLVLYMPFNKRPLVWLYSTDEHYDLSMGKLLSTDLQRNIIMYSHRFEFINQV